MLRTTHSKVHNTVHKTAMLVLASAFVFGPAVAFAEEPQSAANESSTPLMLQMQSEPTTKPTGNAVVPFQHHELFSSEERASTFMFNGITLNEKQRQQLRDLMATQRHYHVDNSALVKEREALHKLIIADNFDDKAVREELEKRMQKELEQRVEMARIHHELYQLLTPEQKTELEHIHQQEMNQHKMAEFQAMQFQ
ncbi:MULTISPECIES: Spy/CpxP family protein refolding chaperone [Providencia]|uniref:Spy/CpxP family protein refolding chaperone n=1 Tax=Providencia TaxID=586 RepID=UPI000807D22F|nr:MULTISPECIES: Spy/CpxP family protein refolding chaperone [Providencia]ELR5287397.1 Spy/CpxP family protein refolding chaperone [Providencia rettgeri]ELR5297346.1 Spy/CpxP family protein refolding chaperone [Providencia rettgeri]EMC8780752.1 Spy/CpxP family protein refolding chaperone [Providencia rettgeri]MBG5901988.1 Spy/CpxP family protein refolding chaperone [Providencia rettgeri]MBG5932659.1 Spy/CpxP family protein refolding chaperone [Providencia rettgeri]